MCCWLPTARTIVCCWIYNEKSPSGILIHTGTWQATRTWEPGGQRCQKSCGKVRVRHFHLVSTQCSTLWHKKREKSRQKCKQRGSYPKGLPAGRLRWTFGPCSCAEVFGSTVLWTLTHTPTMPPSATLHGLLGLRSSLHCWASLKHASGKGSWFVFMALLLIFLFVADSLKMRQTQFKEQEGKKREKKKQARNQTDGGRTGSQPLLIDTKWTETKFWSLSIWCCFHNCFHIFSWHINTVLLESLHRALWFIYLFIYFATPCKVNGFVLLPHKRAWRCIQTTCNCEWRAPKEAPTMIMAPCAQ